MYSRWYLKPGWKAELGRGLGVWGKRLNEPSVMFLGKGLDFKCLMKCQSTDLKISIQMEFGGQAPSKHSNTDLTIQRLVIGGHCVKTHMCSVFPSRKPLGRIEVFYAVSAGPVLSIKLFVQFSAPYPIRSSANLRLLPSIPLWTTSRKFFSVDPNLPLKDLTECSKKWERCLHRTTQWASTSNSTSHAVALMSFRVCKTSSAHFCNSLPTFHFSGSFSTTTN